MYGKGEDFVRRKLHRKNEQVLDKQASIKKEERGEERTWKSRIETI